MGGLRGVGDRPGVGPGRALRVVCLEPFYGGSHRSFLDQWAKRSRHSFTILGLPPRQWKWRMRHAAITFARELGRRLECGEEWDLLWCSDMLNLAELLGLAPAGLRRLPAVVYFHENQLTYPVRRARERDLHFGLTNLTSALAADAVWFNSAFHRDSFLEALPEFLQRMPDHRPLHVVEEIRCKSTVEWPGIEAPSTSKPMPSCPGSPLTIAWVARWEHDKAPETFFRALFRLCDRGLPFRVLVLGERYRKAPPIFAEARRKLRSRIDQWGYLESRSAYQQCLRRADVVVSTARHEFFGVAVLEAIVAGAFPLLPRRLSYPELLALEEAGGTAEHFFDGAAGVIARRLEELARRRLDGRLEAPAARRQAERFLWRYRAPALDRALEAAVSTAERS